MSETFTENMKLSKRDTGDLNWGAGANANLDLLDKHAQMKLLRPPRSFLASLGSGAAGANLSGNTTYFYKITAYNAAGETTENQIPTILEAQVTEPAVPVPILLQWDTVKGASGYKIYKSTSTGTEKFLAQVNGESTVQYTDDGNTAVNGSISVPTTNTAHLSVTKIAAGTGIEVSPANGTGDVTVSNVGVTGVRKQGEASPLAGDIKLEEGSGITLTQDGVNNKITIASSGGGGVGGGYATETVVAPSGSATTDTANIQTALNSASTKGGGTVQLREGIYQINDSLTVPAKVTLAGMGREATTLKGQTALDTANAPVVVLQGGNSAITNLGVDNSLLTGAGGRGDVRVAASDFEIIDCHFYDLKSEGVMFQTGTSDPVERGFIRGCSFKYWQRSAIRNMSIARDIKIDNCHFEGNGNGDGMDLGLGERDTISNCTGKNVRGVLNGQLPPRSTMSNCAWRTTDPVQVHGINLGPNCAFVGNVLEYPCANAFFAAVTLDSVNGANCVVTGNQITVETVGRGIWAFGNGHVISGNRIKSSVGIEVEGSNNTISGNRLEGGAVILESGVTGNTVVGNNAAVTNNSGNTSNIIAKNHVTGLRKHGEASYLAGDVSIEAGTGIALTQDGVNNKITIASSGGGGGGSWSVVSQQTIATDNTDFSVITGLNLDEHLVYRLFLLLKTRGPVNGSAPGVYFNGDTVNTNYWSQLLAANGGSVFAGRNNGPYIGSPPNNNDGAFIEALISRGAAGTPMAFARGNRNTGSGVFFDMTVMSWVTIANVTQLEVRDVLSNAGWGAGSKLILMRLM